tara:strand:+ start:414 stop:773 length:360 start_codon:yes stop_codon:yes gene_type:complete
MVHTRLLILTFFVATLSFGGCYDPCVQLAERICACEPTEASRRACRDDRIQSQQDLLETTEEEQRACTDALETCTCDALDRNETDLCGFTRDEDFGDEELRTTSDGEGSAWYDPWGLLP